MKKIFLSFTLLFLVFMSFVEINGKRNVQSILSDTAEGIVNIFSEDTVDEREKYQNTWTYPVSFMPIAD